MTRPFTTEDLAARMAAELRVPAGPAPVTRVGRGGSLTLSWSSVS